MQFTLRGKIANTTPLTLDKTLSLEGASADAKAVGDALNKKLEHSHVVDNVVTQDAQMPLSANQGVLLSNRIDENKTFIEETKEVAEEGVESAKVAHEAANQAHEAAGEAHEAASKAQDTADEALPRTGGDMTGGINMGGNKLTGLPQPVDNNDAATLEFVKTHVAEQRFVTEASIYASRWVGADAPYTQSVEVEGILETDIPHIYPVYSDNLDVALDQMEAWQKVAKGKAENGYITFTCYEDKPEAAVPIQIEVIRNG